MSTHRKFHDGEAYSKANALLLPVATTVFTQDGKGCRAFAGVKGFLLTETFAEVEAIINAPDFETICAKLIKAAREVIGAIDYAESQKGQTTTDEISNLRAGLKKTLVEALTDAGMWP
jgi:hypothetical protein